MVNHYILLKTRSAYFYLGDHVDPRQSTKELLRHDHPNGAPIEFSSAKEARAALRDLQDAYVERDIASGTVTEMRIVTKSSLPQKLAAHCGN